MAARVVTLTVLPLLLLPRQGAAQRQVHNSHITSTRTSTSRDWKFLLWHPHTGTPTGGAALAAQILLRYSYLTTSSNMYMW
jgi:hypothetical protein